MDDAPALIYLEADDEVTTVVRRVRATTEPRVVVVAPGRSKATSSAIALRLLARAAGDDGRGLVIVGDALTRSLASEAGVPAYASLDDARRAEPAGGSVPAAPRAGIHVVRGTRAGDTAPTMVAQPAGRADEGAETRPLPTARATSPRARARSPGRPRRRVALAAVLVALGALVIAGGVAAAALLPAATVAVAPAVVDVAARTYVLRIQEADRRSGTVEESAMVTASGTYPILEQATGSVTLFNWNTSAVDAPPGTLVAAGAQAFETVLPVVVPAGRLTADGRIQAGEAVVPIMASVPGPAANVPARAIDTVLSEGIRNRLRGFANNQQPLVVNAAPTSGGAERTGVVTTQQDVDEALSALSATLRARVEARLDDEDAIVIAVGGEPEPAFEGVDGLVGAREQPAVEIRGALSYDAWLVQRDEIERLARARLAADAAAVADGYDLVLEDTRVEVTASEGTTERVEVTVTVRGRAVASVDERTIVDRVRGRAAAAAELALRDLGEASVSLWPGWVSAVPEIDWRIDVVIEDGRAPSPAGSTSP